MINIIHYVVRLDDCRNITAIDVKLKYLTEEGKDFLENKRLVATVLVAFGDTTLLDNESKGFTATINPRRRDIVNAMIQFREENELKFGDISNFLEALQEALDKSEFKYPSVP